MVRVCPQCEQRFFFEMKGSPADALPITFRNMEGCGGGNQIEKPSQLNMFVSPLEGNGSTSNYEYSANECCWSMPDRKYSSNSDR